MTTRDEATAAGARTDGIAWPLGEPQVSPTRERSLLATAWLADTFEREMDAGRGFLWLPVAFGAGILIYFALPREPYAPALIAVAVGLAIAAWRTRFRTGLFRALVVAAAIVAGLTAAKLRTDHVAAPTLDREQTVTAVGWIAGLEEAGSGARVYLRLDHADDLDGPAPRTVRITIRSGADALAVGQAITVLTRLTPPSGPVLPGGYDYARTAFYAGLGAYGFAYGAAKPADIGPAPLAVRLAVPLARLREGIRKRIEATLTGDTAHLAVALITGDRGGISEATQEAMRASGLGHILSISGLHMALVAGSAFWLIRALLALSSNLALRRPIKKWAAAGALAVAAFYLGISGAGVATQRSFIMLAIMLTAVMMDRRAITLRNVALAALAVMEIAPESLLTASFHMSFAATAALVAAYEAISATAGGRRALAPAQGLFARLRRNATGLFLTSLIAGLATAPFAAFHFQRIAPLTLVANLAAMPAVGLVVMPMALLSVALMPFGLEPAPLTAMGWGLDWVTRVAEATTTWSAGAGGVPAAPAGALVLGVAGFLWLVIWRERWRFAGLGLVAFGLVLAGFVVRPDVVVDENGTVAAVRAADGGLRILGGKGHNFEVGNWLQADADPRAPGESSLADGVQCDPLGCVAAGVGGDVALVTRPEAFTEDCRRAAVVISRFEAPAGCAAHALVIDRHALARFGAHALYRDGPGFRVDVAYPAVRRPFMPPLAN